MSLVAVALLAVALSFQQGDATVRAELSSHATSVGRPVILTISVRSRSAGDPEIEVPRIPAGLTVVGTSSSTELEISMPGGRTNVVRHDLQILPIRAGQYAIPPATIRIGRATYRTERLDLAVGGSARAQITDPDATAVELRASITPTDPYVGQQLLLRLDAFMPMDPRFHPTRGPSYDPPSPAGFWMQDLPDAISGELRTIRGQPFEVQTYQRAMFALTAGTFTIPPGRLLFESRGGVFFGPRSREARSDSLRVTVRPLPDTDKPASFRGAVGSFAVDGSVDRTAAGAGDAVTYTMRVEGTGNIKSLPAPPFPRIPDVDVYPPSEDATLRIVNGVIGGVRTFQWVLIPRRAGTVAIPPVEYAWFDPASEQYRTAATQPVQIGVTAASAVSVAAGDTVIRPLRLAAGSRIDAIVVSPAFLAAQLVPLLALLGLLLARRRSAGAARDVRSRRPAFQARISALESAAHSDPRAFYATAVELVADIRAASDQVVIHERSDAIAQRLRNAMYAPTTPDVSTRVGDMTAIRRLIDEAAPARRSAGSPQRGATIIIMLTAASTGAVAARQSMFAEGIAQYQQKNYPAAVRDFEKRVQDTPLDAAAWYNLGNAHLHAGDPGRAVWAWLHTLELEPRNTDAAFNLGILNASRAEAAVQHWFPISTAELAMLAAACWWLALLSTAVFIVGKRPGARLGGVLLATACATAVIMLVTRIAGPGVVVPIGQGTPMYSGPTSRTDRRGTLEVGDAALIVRREGEWLLVRTSDYREGWVATSAVADL